MEISKLIELLSYTIPSIITGLVAYYFFLNHTKNEERKLKLSILKKNQKQSLVSKLQAFERMTLFLERMNPSNLLLRVASINNDKNAYVISLISTIEKEFEHNLTQQIYISEKCWSIIIASKNATVQLIKKAASKETIQNAQELKEEILKITLKSAPPSATSLSFLKDEIRSII